MQKIKIKTDWSEISVSEFNQLQNFLKTAEDYDDISLMINILSIISDKDITHYENLPISALSALNQYTEFLNTEVKADFKMDYIINNKKYTTVIDVKKITTAQYIDYNHYTKERPDDIASLLTVFLIPEGAKVYGGSKEDGTEYDPVALKDEFEQHCPITIAMGVSFFFTLLLESWTKAILASSVRKLKKQSKKEKNPVVKTELMKAIREIQGFMENEVGSLSSKK